MFKLLFEYVDTDKENAYTKTEWANLKFIPYLHNIDDEPYINK